LRTSRASSVPSSKETDGTTPREPQFCSMSLENWNEWVTEQRREYSARLKSGRATSGSESSSLRWPTPRAQEACRHNSRDNGVALSWAVQRGLPDPSRPDQNNGGGNLRGVWQTPRSQDSSSGKKPSGEPNLEGQVRIADRWGTPRSQMGGNRIDTGKFRLEEQARARGNLNPRWVETLMGLPIGWTTPSCVRPWTVALMNCDSLETVLTPMSPNELLEPSINA
jgi:hypothetical protein